VDIVYICRHKANEELRYSLRSLVNLDYDSVWVVGGKPSWYVGNYIPVGYTGSKYKHARSNLATIINSDQISSDFILMNDDFYIVKPIKKLEVYNEGLLKDKVDKYLSFAPNSIYTKMLVNTLDYLVEAGIENPISYDLHTPMQMNKEKLAEAMQSKKLWRSTYGNLNNIGGKTIEDVKVYSPTSIETIRFDYLNSDLPFLSTDDKSFNSVKNNLLDKLFPTKSQYEK
jgi:hypothetical protein